MQPGKFLTSYIDEVFTNGRLSKNVYPGDKPVMWSFVKKIREQGVIFASELQNTEISSEKFKQFDASIFRPPYPVTILEYRVTPKDNLPEHKFAAPYRILVAIDGGDHVLLYILLYAETLNKWRDPTFELKLAYNQDDKMSYEIRPFLREQFAANYKYYTQQVGYTAEQFNSMIDNDMLEDLCWYAVFCTLLHDNHVAFNDVIPDAKLNKMRRARGKVPLFTYKVLTIGKKKRKSQQLGGTHASPRSHLRRGYYRTSRKGIHHWVQPCMVKGNTDGFVHKDYIVEQST